MADEIIKRKFDFDDESAKDSADEKPVEDLESKKDTEAPSLFKRINIGEGKKEKDVPTPSPTLRSELRPVGVGAGRDSDKVVGKIEEIPAPPIASDFQAPTIDLSQLQDTPFGKMAPREISTEMQESYLDYAMSVIISRALPDIRDGLKPVHRRILYAMGEINLRHGSKHTKSAKIIGEVLGKYHPHGDLAVYDSLVRMAQTFSMRYPLIDGQGNFGSMDGDPPAAMRYTEARMAAISDELLADIEKETVGFRDNYDGTLQEPEVLPAKIPNLLLNGSMGIAVGMATNIPPHNLAELIEGIIELIDNPSADIDILIQYIKGPDFPTGGTIHGREGIKSAYTTGKGAIIMRGEAEIIEDKKNNLQIIITSIPYQVNKAELVAKIAELVKLKKIDGISDLRDESDRKQGVRVVVGLRQNSYPQKVLNRIYELTSLQTVFHVNLLALVDGIQPRILTLKDVLQEYIKHRQAVMERRTQFDLKKAQERTHILEGLKKALDDIDAVIATIKRSQNRDEAAKNLVEKFSLTQIQANAILEMKLSALAALERQKVEDELKEKKELMTKLKEILESPQKILELIKDELKELKEKYADERKTKILVQELGKFSAEDVIPKEQVIITMTHDNYIKRIPTDTYRKQIRGGKGVSGITTKEEDTVTHLLAASTHDDLLFFTDRGRVFKTKVYELPAGSRQSKGQAIVNVLQISPDEKITAMISLPKEGADERKYFFMATKGGIVKKTEISAYQNIRKTGIAAMGLKEGDRLDWVTTSSGQDKIILVTKAGMSIFFAETDIRPMGRSASGIRGIRLKGENKLITAGVIKQDTNPSVLSVSENGFGKRTEITDFPIQKRGGIGVRAARVTKKTGNLVSTQIIENDKADVVLASKQGQMIRLKIKGIKKLNRDTQGVTLIRCKGNDRVSMVTVVEEPEILIPAELSSSIQPNAKISASQKAKIDLKNIKF